MNILMGDHCVARKVLGFCSTVERKAGKLGLAHDIEANLFLPPSLDELGPFSSKGRYF